MSFISPVDVGRIVFHSHLPSKELSFGMEAEGPEEVDVVARGGVESEKQGEPHLREFSGQVSHGGLIEKGTARNDLTNIFTFFVRNLSFILRMVKITATMKKTA